MVDEKKVAAPVAPAVAEAKAKRAKKLSKTIEGTVVTIKEAVTGKVLVFDASKLPKEIQAKLMPYGLSQKLGDAAAGKEGTEAVDAINKVWDGLEKNDWTVRAPAGEKVDKNSMIAKYNATPAGPLKDMMKKVLQEYGILPADAK